MAHPDLINAFNTCIDRLHAGDHIEDCLRDYPHYANMLRPMLEMSQAVQRANPAASPMARARVRANVMHALAQSARSAPPSRSPFGIRTPRLTLAAATLLIVAFAAMLILTRGRSPDNTAHPPTQQPVTEESLTQTLTLTPTLMPSETATLPATATTAPTQAITPSPTVTLSVTPSDTPTLTPSHTPTNTPTRTPTYTPQPCVFTVQVSSVNLRSGPGTGYGVVDYGFLDDSYLVLARHTSDLWYLLEGDVWIAADVGELSGDCSDLDESDVPYREGDGGGTPGDDSGGDTGDSGGGTGNDDPSDDDSGGGDDDPPDDDPPDDDSGNDNDDDPPDDEHSDDNHE